MRHGDDHTTASCPSHKHRATYAALPAVRGPRIPARDSNGDLDLRGRNPSADPLRYDGHLLAVRGKQEGRETVTAAIKTKTATLCRRYRPGGRLGDAALYWLDPPIVVDNWKEGGEPFDYVVVATRNSQTDVFPADNDGSVLGWSDIAALKAEQRGTHESTLAALGYAITDWGGTRA